MVLFTDSFVEPNDEKLNKVKLLSKLRVYAAGSIANLTTEPITCLIVLGISNFILHAIFEVDDSDKISSVVC